MLGSDEIYLKKKITIHRSAKTLLLKGSLENN